MDHPREDSGCPNLWICREAASGEVTPAKTRFALRNLTSSDVNLGLLGALLGCHDKAPHAGWFKQQEFIEAVKGSLGLGLGLG